MEMECSLLVNCRRIAMNRTKEVERKHYVQGRIIFLLPSFDSLCQYIFCLRCIFFLEWMFILLIFD